MILRILLIIIVFSNSCEKDDHNLPLPNKQTSNLPLIPTTFDNTCSGCHGKLSDGIKANSTVAEIQAAISQIGAMQFLSKLKLAEIEEISKELHDHLKKEDGTFLYERYCKSCHGQIPFSSKQGQSAQTIFYALDTVPQMTEHPTVSKLGENQIKLIAEALNKDVKNVGNNIGLNRLAKKYYKNAIGDTFGPYIASMVDSKINNIPTDDYSSGYANQNFSLTTNHVDLYQQVAKTISEILSEDAKYINKKGFSCLKDEFLNKNCFIKVLTEIFLKLNKYPAGEHKVLELYERFQNEESIVLAFQESVQYLLLSPDFIFDLSVQSSLPEYNISSFLAKVLWNSIPDDELLDLAASQRIFHLSEIQSQIDRMILDHKFERMFSDFLVDVYGDAKKIESKLDKSSLKEIEFLFNRSIEYDFSFSYLLSTTDSVVNSNELAQIYDLDKVPAVDKMVNLVPERAGILTRHFFLKQRPGPYSPIKRGSYLRRNFLCDHLESPNPSEFPPGSLDEPEITIESTLSELWQNKTKPGECQKCHKIINPLGFIMSNFDSYGKWQDTQLMHKNDNEIILRLETSFKPLIGFDRTSQASNATELQRIIVQQSKGESCFLHHFWKDRIGLQSNSEQFEDSSNLGLKTLISNLVLDAIDKILIKNGISQ